MSKFGIKFSTPFLQTGEQEIFWFEVGISRVLTSRHRAHSLLLIFV